MFAVLPCHHYCTAPTAAICFPALFLSLSLSLVIALSVLTLAKPPLTAGHGTFGFIPIDELDFTPAVQEGQTDGGHASLFGLLSSTKGLSPQEVGLQRVQTIAPGHSTVRSLAVSGPRGVVGVQVRCLPTLTRHTPSRRACLFTPYTLMLRCAIMCETNRVSPSFSPMQTMHAVLHYE